MIGEEKEGVIYKQSVHRKWYRGLVTSLSNSSPNFPQKQKNNRTSTQHMLLRKAASRKHMLQIIRQVLQTEV